MFVLTSGVRLLTLALMKIYNRSDQSSAVYNTYQCYLKESCNHLEQDFKLAANYDIPLACKLVRGAYLITEKDRFDQGLIKSYPIHQNYEATNKSYDNAVKACLDWLKIGKDVRITIATHNIQSVIEAVTLLEDYSCHKNSVKFAQINGLGDHISLSLTRQGHRVLKLLPCGTVEEVLPWLGRCY